MEIMAHWSTQWTTVWNVKILSPFLIFILFHGANWVVNDPAEAICLWKLLLFKPLLTLSYLFGDQISMTNILVLQREHKICSFSHKRKIAKRRVTKFLSQLKLLRVFFVCLVVTFMLRTGLCPLAHDNS